MPRQLNVIIFWAFERCLEHRVSLLSAGFPFLHPTPVCFCCNKFPLRRQISLRTRPSLKLPVDVDISDYALIILLINPSVLMFFSPHLEGGFVLFSTCLGNFSTGSVSVSISASLLATTVARAWPSSRRMPCPTWLSAVFKPIRQKLS